MGEAFICRRGGSGAGLNFRVFGGTSAPTTPKENDIWVNTSVEIPEWTFGASDPCTVDIYKTGTVGQGFYIKIDTGEEYTHELYSTLTANLPENTQSITVPADNASTTTVAHAFYDADGALISTVQRLPNTVTYDVPSGAVLVRVSFYQTDTKSVIANIIPSEGTVWITTDASSDIEFNALKKNGIQVCPRFATQYVNGAWEKKDGCIYRNGEWVELSYAPTDGLIAEYTFDSFDGNTIPDSSGNEYTLTLTNVTQTQGVVGKAALFSGNGSAVANSKVVPAGMDGFSGLSVSFWLKEIASAATAYLICSGSVDKTNFYITTDLDGSLGFSRGLSSSYANASFDAGLTDGAWHYFCIVYDYSTNMATAYEDGESKGEWSCIKFSTSTSNLTLGRSPSATNRYLNGALDQVRIYNRALTTAEIARLWNGGAGC